MKGFDLMAILLNPEFAAMLLHGREDDLHRLRRLLAAGDEPRHRAARHPPCSPAASPSGLVAAYVSYHRNVPTLVQLMLWYFGISSLLPDRAADTGCPTTTARRSSRSSRSASARPPISARTCAPACARSPPGQCEAARALGHSYVGAMRYVLMPQAVRNALPALVNHSVSLFKNSSLAMAIGVAELTHAVKEVENQSFRTFETYLDRDGRSISSARSLLMARRRRAGSGAAARRERADHALRHRHDRPRQLAAAAHRPVPERAARRLRRDADPVGARHRARLPAQRR